MKATVEHEGAKITIEQECVTIWEWMEVFQAICLAHQFPPETVREAFDLEIREK